MCRVVPFRLWASGGEPSGSKDLWGFCGARQGTDGHGACAGCGKLRQSSRNPAAIKSGQEPSRKVSKCRAPVLLAERRSPTLRVLRSRRMDCAVRTECPVLARLAGGPLIVAGAEFVRSTEVWDWAAVTGLVIDVMRKITSGLTGLVPPAAAVPVALCGRPSPRGIPPGRPWTSPCYACAVTPPSSARSRPGTLHTGPPRGTHFACRAALTAAIRRRGSVGSRLRCRGRRRAGCGR